MLYSQAGIKKIRIPLERTELSIDNISLYLPKVMELFYENAEKATNLFSYYLNDHTVKNKKRPYDDLSNINHKIAVGHTYAMVNFKKGYAYGNPVEYAQSKELNTDDIRFLDRYHKDCNKRGLDSQIAEWVYSVGNGYSFIEPKSKTEPIDIKTESPFNIYFKAPNVAAKIYSSYNGEAELFDILVTKLEKESKDNESKTLIIVSVYTPDFYFEFYSGEDSEKYIYDDSKTQPRSIYKMLPLTEKYSNENRVGLVEISKTINDAVDKIYSDTLDNIDETVNTLLVFLNCSLGKTPEEESETLKASRKNGAIVLTSPNKDIDADVKPIEIKLNYSDIISLIDELTNTMYNICGVPLLSSDTSAGGNKQGALQLGNGWENAYNRLLDDINNFIKADYELLKKELFIAKKFVGCPLNEICASEIEIKYNPNMTDNMLVRSQSYINYINSNVPPLLAMQWCRVTNDPVTAYSLIEEYNKKNEAENEEKVIDENSNLENI